MLRTDKKNVSMFPFYHKTIHYVKVWYINDFTTMTPIIIHHKTLHLLYDNSGNELCACKAFLKEKLSGNIFDIKNNLWNVDQNIQLPSACTYICTCVNIKKYQKHKKHDNLVFSYQFYAMKIFLSSFFLLKQLLSSKFWLVYLNCEELFHQCYFHIYIYLQQRWNILLYHGQMLNQKWKLSHWLHKFDTMTLDMLSSQFTKKKLNTEGP